MDSSARYSALEHGGLELAPTGNNAPEVYAPDSGNESKEVVPGSSPPVERRRSTDAAEVTHPKRYEQQEPLPGEHTVAPYYADDKGFYHGAGLSEGEKVGNDKAQRRCCGMKRWLFFVVIGVIAFIVVLAAVLGGVLGTKNNSSQTNYSNAGNNNGSIYNSSSPDSNSTSAASAAPLQAMANSGLATAVVSSGTGRLLMYYQDESGRIIENSYYNGAWTLENSSNIEASVVVSSGVQQGSPLAAIAYIVHGTNIRQVFFLDGSGILHETSSSTVQTGIATSWSAPQVVIDLAASPNSISIAACVDNGPLNGIRVYYGTTDPVDGPYVQEVGYQFNETTWAPHTAWFDADPDSGIACGIWDNTNPDTQLIDLYFRNSTSGVLQQTSYDYTTDEGWYLGPTAPAGLAIMQGGDVAVCDNPGDNEYAHWPLANGTIVRSYYDPISTSLSFGGTILENQMVSAGSKMAATWTSDGVVLFYQNGTNASNIYMSTITRNGALVADVAVV